MKKVLDKLRGKGGSGEPGVDYAGAWDSVARSFEKNHPDLEHIGDEWDGYRAGAARTNAEYVEVIREKVLGPSVEAGESVLEIGIGGGRTAAMMLEMGVKNLCLADVSDEMLRASRERLGEERVSYAKLDGTTLGGVPERSFDACIVFDTLVHIEPRDIFNYLTRIPAVLRSEGRRHCLFHHCDTTSELGFQHFLMEWDQNLLGRRKGWAFSLMTKELMERFLAHLGYEVLECDTDTIPRDVVWRCRAPESIDPALLAPTHERFARGPG